MKSPGEWTWLQALRALPHRRPWTLVLVSVACALVGGLLQATVLEIRSDRRGLSDPDRPLNRRTLDYREDFGVESQIVWVVRPRGEREGATDAATRTRMKRAADALAERLRAHPEVFPRVFTHAAPSAGGGLGALYLPRPAFDDAVAAVRDALPRLEALAANPSLEGTFLRFAEALRDDLPRLMAPENAGSLSGDSPAVRAGFALSEQFFTWVGRAVRDAEAERPVFPLDESLDLGDLMAALGEGAFDPDGYVFTDGGEALLVVIAVRGETGRPNQFERAMDLATSAADEALRAVQALPGDALEAGFAGRPALEAEEVGVSRRDFTRGALAAMVLVSLLFMVAFANVVRPALAALCLGISIGSTFAFAWLAVGHLNLVAMVFAVILVALGIDFAIHFATHYERQLHGLEDGGDEEPTLPRERVAHAVEGTLAQIGGALLLGGATTAAAFWTAAFTEAPGLSELGLIAGGGLVICIVVMMLVYPAMLVLLDRARGAGGRRRARDARRHGEHPVRIGPVTRAGAVVLVLMAVAGFATGEYRFDTNILALQPRGSEAAAWSDTLRALDGRTQYAIALYDDRETLEAQQARLEALDGIVRSTRSVFPRGETERRAVLAPLAARIEALRARDPAGEPGNAHRAAFRLLAAVRRVPTPTPEAAETLVPLREQVESVYRQLGGIPRAERAAVLEPVDAEIARVLDDALARLQAFCSPPPFAVDRAPAPLRERFVGTSGRLALLVHPVENTWEPAAMRRFVDAALAVEPGLFEGIVAFQDNADVMVRSFGRSSVTAVVVVLLLLLVVLRSPLRALLAMLPLVVSIGILLGVMRWSPYPLVWNFANFFALPTLVGIGVDSGIHLTIGWDHGPAVFRGARRAVWISTTTTLIGFAVLATAHHVGVQSLGLLLSIGIGAVLATSLVVLPVALRLVHGPAGGRLDRPAAAG